MPVMIAKFCDLNKQHFAHVSRKTLRVTEKPITQVVAEAIAYYMQTQDPPLKEAALGDAAGGLLLGRTIHLLVDHLIHH